MQALSKKRKVISKIIFDDKNVSAEEFTESAGTISYEILTALSKRIKRVVLN